jgi:hypothetical protein
MGRNRAQSIPKFTSLDELVEFFESHDMGEYWDEMPEAHFDINIERKTHVFAIDEDLAESLTRIAQSKHVTSERLINTWLREKLSEQK